MPVLHCSTTVSGARCQYMVYFRAHKPAKTNISRCHLRTEKTVTWTSFNSGGKREISRDYSQTRSWDEHVRKPCLKPQHVKGLGMFTGRDGPSGNWFTFCCSHSIEWTRCPYVCRIFPSGGNQIQQHWKQAANQGVVSLIFYCTSFLGFPTLSKVAASVTHARRLSNLNKRHEFCCRHSWLVNSSRYKSRESCTWTF